MSVDLDGVADIAPAGRHCLQRAADGWKKSYVCQCFVLLSVEDHVKSHTCKAGF